MADREPIKSTDLVPVDRCEVVLAKTDKSVVIVFHGPNGSRHVFQPSPLACVELVGGLYAVQKQLAQIGPT
jgi:hypothetical protein